MNRGLRILLLEDVLSDAELLERKLHQAGLSFSLQRVETEEAFTRELEYPLPDLIFSDYSLPSFDGLSALVIAQEKCPDVPFILISGAISEDVAIEALKKGATDYVLKDRLSRLVPVVHRALKEFKEHTERKKAEEKLRREHNLLQTLIDTTPDSIYFKDVEGRFVMVNKTKAEHSGIKPEDIIIDPLAQSVGVDGNAGLMVTETIYKIKTKLGVNMTLGASNISFGLPNRSLLTGTFLAVAITSGVTCPIVDVARVRQIILATDLLLGRDSFAMRYIEGYRRSK